MSSDASAGPAAGATLGPSASIHIAAVHPRQTTAAKAEPERLQQSKRDGADPSHRVPATTPLSAHQHEHEQQHGQQQHQQRRIGIVHSLAAGAIAGAVAKTAIAPLDRVKIMFQVTPNKHYHLSVALHTVLETYRREGLAACWRGNSATMLRIMPSAALQFMSFQQYKQLLLKPGASDLDPGRRFLTGSLAGCTATMFTYPLDLMRARLAIQSLGNQKYSSMRNAFATVWRTEGLFAFWHGASAALVGIAPYAGVTFFTFETLKLYVREHHAAAAERAGRAAPATAATPSPRQVDELPAQPAGHRSAGALQARLHQQLKETNAAASTLTHAHDEVTHHYRAQDHDHDAHVAKLGDESVTAVERLVCGAVAGLVGQSSTYPLDVVRRRMQTDGFFHAPDQRRYHSVPSALVKIAREEGIRALYRGLSMNFIKGPIAASVSFTIFDLLSRYLNDVFPSSTTRHAPVAL
ncbi:solute carrier family 25 member 42 [Capsaspora owczarzaki ATCC 30864]|uniref:Solute carrier family 25 member 42 n=1 Tax=Capsaspora owczarzaki (strain ATCC 30864) TaxID=595528 RepID=A0A0D2WPA3_CAPO3|nr:solute carrier family 25 member 42 [Capsaspora owczarzaki ATCC 30864]KJE92458.1 solute carrier family 25 member 42 [Capsaspora owczarzaki ATCC 30864]|eukprot:XP_004364270.1 solute carrier family 25 member 42 [Capsaspora owczarzaki ATCC 30864]